MGQSIIISSGKGGVGKTNIAINLGVALSRLGKKVIIVDASLTTPDISLHLGIPFHIKSLAHLLKDNSDIDDAAYGHKSGLRVIPGHVHIDVLKEFEGKKFSKLLNKLKQEHDFVLVDCAPSLGREAISAIKSCDSMIAVANPEIASAVNCSKALQIAKELNVKPIGVVLNKVNSIKHELKESDIKPLLYDVPIIGKIPHDKNMLLAIKKSESVVDYYPESAVSREFENMASLLSGVKVKKYKGIKKAKKIKKANAKIAKKQKTAKITSKKGSMGIRIDNPLEKLEIGRSIPKSTFRQNILESLKEIHSK
jgi:MinD-like ATPase involved in chromosome partitioning or flagellar assembly